MGNGSQLCGLWTARKRATSLMYEGAPNFPEPDRFWRIVEKHG